MSSAAEDILIIFKTYKYIIHICQWFDFTSFNWRSSMRILLALLLISTLGLSACADHGHLDCDDPIPINHSVILPCPAPIIHIPRIHARRHIYIAPRRPVIVIRPSHPPIIRPRPHYPRYRVHTAHHSHRSSFHHRPYRSSCRGRRWSTH